MRPVKNPTLSASLIKPSHNQLVNDYTEPNDSTDGTISGNDTWGDALIRDEMKNAIGSWPHLIEAPSGWFVYFSYRNPATGKMKKFKKIGGLNQCTSIDEKRKYADMLILKYKNLLRSGWNPFSTDDENTFVNHLEYVRQKRQLTSPDHNISYWASVYIDQKIKNGMRDKSIATYLTKLRMFDGWIKKNNLNNMHYNAFSMEHAQ
jgi:capsule polysaccharide export protein KpsC/LpsZ